MNKLIELCGLAGSGKSTAALALCDLLRRRGRPVVVAGDLPRLAAARQQGGMLSAVLPTSILRRLTPDMSVPALGRFVAGRPALLAVLIETLSRPNAAEDDRRAAATSLLHTVARYQMALECLRDNETRHAYTAGELARVLRELGEDPDPRRIAASVAANSLYAITGRRRGEEDRISHKRKSVVGDWRNYFTPELTALVLQRQGNLLKNLGYAANDQPPSAH